MAPSGWIVSLWMAMCLQGSFHRRWHGCSSWAWPPPALPSPVRLLDRCDLTIVTLLVYEDSVVAYVVSDVAV